MNNLVMLALWVLVGLLAGWLARVVVKHGGYGMREDLFLGLVGSLVGGGIVWTLARDRLGTLTYRQGRTHHERQRA
jgi:uncharacterized membrane protein YeaQ/YmgE (transglycosylase-associated protein family)